MPEPEVRRTIDAPAERVWQILTDPALLQRGDFGIRRLDGALEPGGRLKLWSDVAPDRAFSLRVTRFEPAREMVWEGGMPLGLFKGTRRFTLTPDGDRCVFEMSERFTGLLSGPITRSMPDLQPSFESFADALEAHAEGSAS